MLKLEKTSKRGTVKITLRDKEKFFSKSLTIAFALAVSLHLCMFVIFHIVPYNSGFNETIFKPVEVEIHSLFKDSVFADTNPIAPTIKGLPSPLLFVPEIPKYPPFTELRSLETIKKNEHLTFKILEKREHTIEPLTLNPLIPRSQNPLKIIISGPLAEYPVVSIGLNKETITDLLKSQKEEIRIIYSIAVEGKSGEIFWANSHDSIEHPMANQFAKTLLKTIQFSEIPNNSVVTGELEIHFYTL